MTLINEQTSDARDEIIASIRASLSASRPFDVEHQKHHRPVSRPVGLPVPHAELLLGSLIDSFVHNLEAVGAIYKVVSSNEEAADAVLSVIEKTGARRIATSDSQLVSAVLPDDAPVEIVTDAAPETLFGCDLGVTSAQWAIAETGTLVLESEAETHRLTSLVPRVHLCIVKAEHIRQTLGEILSLTRRPLNRTITFITGASRTSDIELTLAIGVHGPAELHVIVIADPLP